MELIFAFLAWLGVAELQMPAPPARAPGAELARAAPQLPPRILGGSHRWLVVDQGDESARAAPPDPPVAIVAISDDRVDSDEAARPWQDKDWDGLLPFGPRRARAAFGLTTRLPLSLAAAKWLYRAWGQP